MPDEGIFVHGWLSPGGVEFMRGLFKALIYLLTRVEAHGQENLPPGGLIISPNHLSAVDPPLARVVRGQGERPALVVLLELAQVAHGRARRAIGMEALVVPLVSFLLRDQSRPDATLTIPAGAVR